MRRSYYIPAGFDAGRREDGKFYAWRMAVWPEKFHKIVSIVGRETLWQAIEDAAEAKRYDAEIAE